MTRHLALGLLAALALLGLPPTGTAADRSRPTPTDRDAPPPPSMPAPAEARPAPPPPGGASQGARPPPPPPDGTGQARPPPPGARPGSPPGYVYVPPPPYWYGWGWGWGYAPLWGWGWWAAPPPPGALAPSPPLPPAQRVISTLRGTYMEGDGSGGGLAFMAEGRQAGFRCSLDGLAPDRIDGAAELPGTDGLTYGVMAGSWALAAAETHRLRLEAGGSMLASPSTGSYQGTPYAGTTAFGLLLGLSGQVGLVGPIGLEGHLRTTPYPVLILDAGVAMAWRIGPLAFSGGWRWFDVSGSSDSGPTAHLSAPELGVALAF